MNFKFSKFLTLIIILSLILSMFSYAFSDEVLPSNDQKEVVEEAAKFLEDMGNKNMAENVRKWITDNKVKIDEKMSSDGTTDRKANIVIKGSFVRPLPKNSLEKFKRVAKLASLLLHEKTHAHQAPEGGDMYEGVQSGDWTAGYDVHDECIGPDPLEVEAYYKKLREYLIWIQKINEEKISEDLSKEDKEKAEEEKNNKIKWLKSEITRWAKILKSHNYEKANKIDKEYIADKFKGIDDNKKLSEMEKVKEKKDLLDKLIGKLFDKDDFYDQARKLYEKKQGDKVVTALVQPPEGYETKFVEVSLPGNNGKVTIAGFPNNIYNSEVLEISIYNFMIPPVPDPGYEFISPVFDLRWNAAEAVPIEIKIGIDEIDNENLKIAAFGLKKDYLKNRWTILESEIITDDDGMLTVNANSEFATMYAVVVPKASFEDLHSSHWCFEAVERMRENGVLDSDLMFNPNMLVTRERFLKYLVRGLDLELVEDPIPFEDVDMNNPYFPYISTAYHNELTQGISENEFGFGGILNREQSMTFLIRAMNKEYDALKISHGERMDYLQRFKDLETGISQWAYQYIVQAGRMGLTEGYPDGTMRGKGELNHAEVITLIDRMIISIKHNGL